MSEFAEAAGIGKAVLSPSLPEGEEGRIEWATVCRLWGDMGEGVLDFAAVFTSDLHSVGECAAIVCRSPADALTALEAAEKRIEALRRAAPEGEASRLHDAFVIRRGRLVIMCALADNARARELWDRIL